MRVVQIVDSLEIGGAERMAVNYANALSQRIAFSGLVATRKEGGLHGKVSSKVHYLFLQRTSKIDWGAILRLRSYCKRNQIEWLHPHSSSYFIAVLVKLTMPRLRIVWHDHNGLSEFLHTKKWMALRLASFFFSGIISVNYQLTDWAIKTLNCKRVIYLPNFTVTETDASVQTTLQGESGKRILCLANLREQKNHFMLLDVAKKMLQSHPEWSFHLVGKDFEDDYSRRLKQIIQSEGLSNVYLYGSRNDTVHIISQSDIAILTSKSEGLPVSLLELGLYGKPVVMTAVGEIPMIVADGQNGFVTEPSAGPFYESLVKLVDDAPLRARFGKALHETIGTHHSETAIIGQYLKWIETIANGR
jgi:glycosyltransferase involved in cell wall biosynthesis